MNKHYDRICAICNAPFIGTRETMIYCSKPCNIAASKKRRQREEVKAKARANQHKRYWSEDTAYKEWSKEYVKTRMARIRHYLNAYKMVRGCAICGYNTHPAALDLDHIDANTKTLNIGKCMNLTRIIAELPLTQVLCSNCHRVKTMTNKEHLKVCLPPSV